MGNNKPNAYSIFVRDEHRRRERNGECVNYQSLFKELDSKWRGLPEEMRQRYKDRAKNGGGPPGPNFFKKTSTSSQESVPAVEGGNVKKDEWPNDGPSTRQYDAKPRQGLKREADMDGYDDERERLAKKAKSGFAVPNWKNIVNSGQPDADRYADYHLVKIRNSCESIVNTRASRIISMPICTFSANVLCKHRKDDKDVFIPIEIGMYCYSIEEGALGKPFHVLIDAGPVPMGYQNASRDHSMANHKICFQNNKSVYPMEARSDYYKIYKEMIKYTKKGERTILISDERDLAQAQGCIEWLFEKASEFESGLQKPSTWTIMPLIEYVAASHNFVYQKMLHHPKPQFALHYFLKVMRESSNWDYDESLMCTFHKRESNQSKWCAQNCAIRSIKCMERILEGIYRLYKVATEPPPRPPPPQAQPQPQTPIVAPPKPVPQQTTTSNPLPSGSPQYQPMAIEAPPLPPNPLDPRIRRDTENK